MSDLILYTTEDGSTRLDLRIEGGTAWLTQVETAALFATTKNNVSLHVRNIFQEGELTPEATVKESGHRSRFATSSAALTSALSWYFSVCRSPVFNSAWTFSNNG